MQIINDSRKDIQSICKLLMIAEKIYDTIQVSDTNA